MKETIHVIWIKREKQNCNATIVQPFTIVLCVEEVVSFGYLPIISSMLLIVLQ